MFLLFMNSEAQIVNPTLETFSKTLELCNISNHLFLSLGKPLYEDHKETFSEAVKVVYHGVNDLGLAFDSDELICDSVTFLKRLLSTQTVFVNGSALQTLETLRARSLNKPILCVLLNTEEIESVDNINTKNQYISDGNVRNIKIIEYKDLLGE